jgi:hypothetical protein
LESPAPPCIDRWIGSTLFRRIGLSWDRLSTKRFHARARQGPRDMILTGLRSGVA